MPYNTPVKVYTPVRSYDGEGTKEDFGASRTAWVDVVRKAGAVHEIRIPNDTDVSVGDLISIQESS